MSEAGSTQGEKVILEPEYYVKRYILSWCMEWNEASYLRSDGQKSWKKAIPAKVRLNLENLKLEVSRTDKSGEHFEFAKSDIQSVSLEETKDSENKISFILITFNGVKSVPLAITGKKNFLDYFYCGLCIHINQIFLD